MAETLRVGVVGCGVIAPAHIESFQRLENVEVAWVCDLVEEKAREKAQKYGVPNVCTDYAAMLADETLDAVSVCTDHASHAPISVAALEAGKHVLCEKALAAHTDGLDAMMAAHAKRPALVFGGVFQHRFDAIPQYLRTLIQEEKTLGTLLTAGVQVRCKRTDDYYRADRWRGTWAEEGGAVLINQAIHFIDSLCWIVGGVKALAGTHENLTHGNVIETEDTAVAALRFKNGALGTIEATSSSHMGWENTLSFHGSEGSIDVRDGKSLKIAFADEAKGKRILEELDSCRDQRAIEAGKSYYGPSHPHQIEDFVEAIREKRAPFVTARSARHTVDVVLAIYRANREGGWVDIDSEI